VKTKTFLNLILLLILSLGLSAQQNLVSNPSFEDYYSCPNFASQIEKSTGWIAATPTPDYFNTCATGYSWCTVPINYFGTRTPASGNAYAGIISSEQNSEHREIIGVELSPAVQSGTTYYASMKIALAGQVNPSNYCGLNKLGFLFSTIIYDLHNNAPTCNSCAQIYSDTIITDTLNWTTIKGSFVADSSYTYMYIGRFHQNILTDFFQIVGTGRNSYYYIDDVCLSTDSNVAYNYHFNEISENRVALINLFPNPANELININCNINIKSLAIFNLYGFQVQQSILDGNEIVQMNVHALPKGIYILIITERNTNIIYKKLFVKI
jgi:hypothetical protein